MNNNWLPGALLTMVIISQPKSTGSRLIRDTSVLFTIHLQHFFFFNVEANLFRLQARSLVSKKAFSLFLILSDPSAPERERRPPAGQKGLRIGRSSLQRPGKWNPV